jgi:hypothetical protein
MPFYCYRKENGEVIELFMTVAEMEKFQDKEGNAVFRDEKIKRDIISEQREVPSTAGNWPQESDALGVHPSQVAQARQESIRLGVPTEFTSDGQAILTSASHRKQFAEALGYYDRNAGYNDPLPKRAR